MKDIRLKRIKLSNWKAKNLDVEFFEKETRISAKNEVGKSSLQQAWNWVFTSLTTPNAVKNHELFDNRVPLSVDTPEASVKVWIEIDGDEYTIERIAKAKFNRPRGQVEYVKASSDEYTVKLDNIEMSATDFDGWVSAMICPMEMMPFVLDGAFFSTLAIDNKMKARSILESLIKVVDVSKFGDEYDDVKKDLKSFSLDQLKEQALTDIKISKKRIDEIPLIIRAKERFIAEYGYSNQELKERVDTLNELKESSVGKVLDDELFADIIMKSSYLACQSIIERETSAIERLYEDRRKEAVLLARKEGRKAKVEAFIEEVAEHVSREVNAMLGDCKVVMFDTLRNGEKVPNCILTNHEGVKFATLSTSARLRINIAVQDMFRKRFGVNMVTWIDEAAVFDVEHLPRPDGQVCYLFAGDSDTLIVE